MYHYQGISGPIKTFAERGQKVKLVVTAEGDKEITVFLNREQLNSFCEDLSNAWDEATMWGHIHNLRSPGLSTEAAKALEEAGLLESPKI